MNASEFLTLSAEIVPDRPVTVFEGRRTSYAEMRTRVNRLANGLAGLGVRANDRVAVLQVNSDEAIQVYFATAHLGAVCVPLNYRARGAELAYMVNESSPRVFFVGAEYNELVDSIAPELSSVERYVALGGEVDGWHSIQDLADTSGEETQPRGDGDELTVILFTAGTTDRPKGVMLSHDSFSSYVLGSLMPADPNVEERNILAVPLYHIAGMQAVIAAVYSGRTVVVQRQFEAAQWMQLVESERVTRAMVVPTMLKMLMDHPEFRRHDLSSLEVITYGAAPMPLEVIRRAIKAFPGASFINAYGQTETAATITSLSPEDHDFGVSGQELETKLRRLSSVGRPLPDVEVRIVDEDGNNVAPGEVGEVVARGSRLMSGYWHMTQATAEAMRGGWLHTGDLGHADEDGYIFLSGRSKDFIKRGGEMISPDEVERVLHQHPGIEEAAVIGVPDADWGETVRAVVVPRRGQQVQSDDVIEFCRERLASFKKPESVVLVRELPRNQLGKVLKRLLREQVGEATEPDS